MNVEVVAEEPIVESVATDETPIEAEAPELDVDFGEEGEQSPDPDEIEEELEGLKVRGRKEALEKLKAERMMQADYTRKTQEVAEHRKAVEAEKAQLQQQALFQQQFIKEVAQITAIDERLAQFQNANWQQIINEDPQRALMLQAEFQQLQAAKGQLVGSLTQKQQQQALEQQRNSARLVQEGLAVLQREIKGWSPELAAKLVDYGKNEGYAPEVLSNVTQPQFVKTLHKAYLYDQLVKQKTAKPAPPPPQEPVKRVSGAGAATTKKLSDMTMDEFVAHRRKYQQTHR